MNVLVSGKLLSMLLLLRIRTVPLRTYRMACGAVTPTVRTLACVLWPFIALTSYVAPRISR